MAGNAEFLVAVQDDGAGMPTATQQRVRQESPSDCTACKSWISSWRCAVGRQRACTSPVGKIGERSWHSHCPSRSGTTVEVKTLTVLIADDEPLARSRLRRLLKPHDVQIVGEAENAAQTLRLAEDLQPDLLLLDIQMPGLTGMQIAETLLRLEPAPLLIFVTGFSEYAVAAFETDALDYLLKPVTSERLKVSLERVRTRLTDRQARLEAQRRIREEAEAAAPLRSLPARGDYTVRFIPLNDILCAIARESASLSTHVKANFAPTTLSLAWNLCFLRKTSCGSMTLHSFT